METRGRKRAEATTSPSTSSSSSHSPRAASKRPRASVVLMDSSAEISSGSGHGRRNRNRNPNRNSENKGKEKEQDFNLRVRESDNNSNNYMDEDDDDDDDDDDVSEGSLGILPQNLTSASNALQGLLRKLGAGLDDFLPSAAMGSASSSQQSTKLKKILSGLRADGEEGKQIEALTQLCEMLCIGTEDSLSSFAVDTFVPVLVGLLNYETNPDIMLLAARALTHLCDVLPSSCATVVHCGAVPSFVSRLLTIEYMDLAEQSLLALKKISQEHPGACLKAGALMAVLSYLDFFPTGVQRVALSTAANMCKKIPSDAADFVMEAVPLLTNLLQYHDAKVLDHASDCLTRIAEAFASSPDKLDELCNHGLVTQAVSLISPNSSGSSQASLSPSTYTGLMRLLSTCASGSPLGAKTLLLLGISGILKDILTSSGLNASISLSSTLSRSPAQISEIVNLANELLPPLPRGIISLPDSSSMFIKGSSFKKSPTCSSGKEELSGNAVEVSSREKLLNDQPELLQRFGMDILPVVVQTYGSSVNPPVRYKCLSIIGKLMFFSSADMILSFVSTTNISSFLAGILAWKDPAVLEPSLQIAEILMEKLPESFSKMFVREGVVHAIDLLCIAGSSSNENDNDCIPGSSRSRRYRRRLAGSNTDANYAEDKRTVTACVSPPNTADAIRFSASIRMSVSECAQAFKDKYFPSDPGSAETVISDDLLRLKNLCIRLGAGVDDQKTKSKGKSKASTSRLTDFSPSKEENVLAVISEMLLELSKGDSVSTFEFIGSGVVTALLNYFSCGYFCKERISATHLPKFRQQVLRRYKAFVALSLPLSADDVNVTPMSVLVQKLQCALTSLDPFPVALSQSSLLSTGNARPSSGFSVLSQPFKLRLCRARGEKSLRDYSSNVVLIDPLASLAAVENFLWPRVQRGESGQKPSESMNTHIGVGASSPSTSTPASTTCRHSTRSRTSINMGEMSKNESFQMKNASSLKGKGKSVLKPTQTEERGPRTRNATRRRAALDIDEEMKPVDLESTLEEELDISPVNLDDVLVIDEDEISQDDEDDHDDMLMDDSLPDCMPEKVHDVKLGDLAEDSPAGPAISDSQNLVYGSSSRVPTARGSDEISFGSRGAMSFAAAAMAGLVSANGRGIRGSDRQGRSLFGSTDPPKLVFSVGGKQLNRNYTIFQVVRRIVLDEDDNDRSNGSDFVSTDGTGLSDIWTITYESAENQTERASTDTVGAAITSKSVKAGLTSNSDSDSLLHHTSPYDGLLQAELPCDLEKSNPTYDVLALLRVLDGLNQLAPRLCAEVVMDKFSEGKITSPSDFSAISSVMVPPDEFINSKLTSKLSRQIQDALALCFGSIPSWCSQLTKACPFLFPFETRRQYFYSTSFGLSRALYRLQQQQGTDGHGSSYDRELRVERLQRQKVRVSRNRILESAAKVMEMYSSQKAVLEVEYFGEIGTGLGPTLEFYTLLSRDLQRVGLGMWRSNSSLASSRIDVDSEGKKCVTGGEIISAPLGLFPRPWAPTAEISEGSQLYKVVEHFRLLGRVIAKALQDGRLLDLPLSLPFYKLVLGQELDLHDIVAFDLELGKTLLELQALVSRKKHLELAPGLNSNEVASLRFHGTPVEDLCLDFTLPGYPDFIIKPGDDNVDINSLEEYISLVVDATIKTGIMRQMEAFRAGFNQVFDISALQLFSPKELDYLLCGRRELWEAETLVEHIKFDHGYTSKSPVIARLLEIMGEFNPDQQRAFCQFVTGAPRLPPGGLAALNPKLTIVRKHSSTTSNMTSNGTGMSESADDDLPSVMTCANYLKLPPYSSKEIMYKKLLYAISEGQGSFDLS